MQGKSENWTGKSSREDLSCDDLLFLLSLLEGELQARDEVLAILKSEKTDSSLLWVHYGLRGKEMVLCALQRDSLLVQQDHLQDMHEKSMTELSHLVEAQKCCSKKMMEQLKKVSSSHREALHRLEVQEKSHKAFIRKSNCLATLLEQDRERLKLLLIKEREYHKIKEEKNERELSILKEELAKLKAFALLVIKEQQSLSKLVEEQKRDIKDLIIITDIIEQGVCAAKPSVKVEEELKSPHPHSCLKQSTMTAPSLLTEVELLRRRVVEMEGKDEELIRMAEQCRDLDQRLVKETSHCRNLKVEVDKLNGRISELDRIEEALIQSKQDCSIIRSRLEQEKEVGKMLSGELDTLRLRVRELEAVEAQLEKSEMVVRQDLAKLRSLTVALVDDRKSMAERLRQAEENINRKESKRNEQGNLATMTERLREEKQLALKSMADLEEKIKGIAKEKDELQDRLKTEENRNRELQSKIVIMKRKLHVFDNRKEKEEKYTYSSTYQSQTEDNKVKELIQQLDKLQNRLKDNEMLEGELIKVKDDFESLERRLKDEQRRSQALREELDVAMKELSRYKQTEKQEVNQEHLLLCCLQKEQVKSRLLTREVDTLKEKLQKLMGAEESICRVQMDQSTLQRKLTQQEAKKRELAREMEELTNELDGYRKIKNLTPGANISYSDHHQTKEVQTEPAESILPDNSRSSRRLNKENVNKESNENTASTKRRSSSLVNSLNSLNNANNICQANSHSETDKHPSVNGEVMMLTHTPGQPLHIKVTPYHLLNTATLEISSPSGDTTTSYTSTAVIPTSGASPKQRITIIQNSGPPAVNSKTHSLRPDRTISPLNGTPTSQILSPNSSRCVTPDNNNSPIQIVTVRTCTPEPTEVTNQAIFCKTPEQPNSWQHQKVNSNDTSPSIITTEDSKIHIHLGSPFIQPLNGMTHSTPQPVGPFYLRHEQKTHVVTNGCQVKGVGKIMSSITISPANASASHSNISASGLCD
ncbi:filamin A-interacting protein 1-like [Melanotaenia boesemani]|uniref:filamin A-interacting protein 1-like n=1 Tax=Melanotaenia boesemani TaxID=1250792 RepID=UPI001C03E33C|nr:filamin A-interacting protein 1-like [Melanotaenia boesemani]